MPLKSGRSNATVSKNIREMMHSAEEKGSIGHVKTPTKKKAQEVAVAVALKKAGRSNLTKKRGK